MCCRVFREGPGAVASERVDRRVRSARAFSGSKVELCFPGPWLLLTLQMCTLWPEDKTPSLGS